jgi:hypothetical protein
LCYVLIGSLNKVKEIVKNEKKKRKNTFWFIPQLLLLL